MPFSAAKAQKQKMCWAGGASAGLLEDDDNNDRFIFNIEIFQIYKIKLFLVHLYTNKWWTTIDDCQGTY